MATSRILKDLQKERASLAAQLERLGVAIAALGGKAGPANKRAKGKAAPKRRRMSAARKKAVSARMKKYWKERKRKERGKK